MKNISANFKLKDSQASTIIYLKTYFNYQRFTYSTGRKINPIYWDEGSQRPITFRLEQLKKELRINPLFENKHEIKVLEDLIKKGIKANPMFQIEMKNITTDLNRHVDELDTAYQYLVMQKEAVTPERLKELLDIKLKQQIPVKKQQNNFFQRFDEFIENLKQTSSLLTIKKYNTLKTRLKEFEKKKRYKITFESIDLVFYDKFSQFLATLENKRIEGGKGLLNDTVSKYFSAIKSFMQWTFDRGYHKNTVFQHKKFSAKKKSRNEIVTLTEDELNILYKHHLNKDKKLQKVRDIFCFAAFTGQRWSDFENFRREDVKNDVWEFMSVKTKKMIRVPFKGFIKPALDILTKYDFRFPVISQQKFNEYIKTAGEIAEINEPVVIKRFSGKKLIEIRKPKHDFISSHMARRTCITILLQKGIPATTIMKLTGHTDLKTLMKYENTSHDALAEALENT
jgi:integrase